MLLSQEAHPLHEMLEQEGMKLQAALLSRSISVASTDVGHWEEHPVEWHGEIYGADECDRMVTVGSGAAVAKESYHRSLARLQRAVAEVKALCRERCDRDVYEGRAPYDEIVHILDAEGTEWVGMGAVSWERQLEARLQMQEAAELMRLAEASCLSSIFDDGLPDSGIMQECRALSPQISLPPPKRPVSEYSMGAAFRRTFAGSFCRDA